MLTDQVRSGLSSREVSAHLQINVIYFDMGRVDQDAIESLRLAALVVLEQARMAIDYAAGGRLKKLRLEEAWETIKDLSQHKGEEEWNDPFFFEKGIPDYIDSTLELELENLRDDVRINPDSVIFDEKKLGSS
ncbi:hypothetical protein Tco_0398111 [Tanacetum coccineum]